jgi:hypothetical protein
MDKESVDKINLEARTEYSKKLIHIFNSFFEYGFSNKKFDGELEGSSNIP